MNAESPKGDKFTLVYFLWAVVPLLIFAAGNQLDRLLNLYLLVLPLVLLPAIVVVIALLASLVLNLVKRRWRRVLSVLVGPPVAFAIFVFADHHGFDADRIRFELTKSSYAEQTARMPREGSEPLLAKFDWGEIGGAGVANLFYTLVFDESDELALPEDQRSEQWKQRVNAKMPSLTRKVEGHHVDVRKMEGHFYLVTEIYQ